MNGWQKTKKEKKANKMKRGSGLDVSGERERETRENSTEHAQKQH